MKLNNEMIVREYFERNGYRIIETKHFITGMIGVFGVKNNHHNVVVTEINVDGTTEDYTSIDSQKFIVEPSDTNIKVEKINSDLRILKSLFSYNKKFNI